MSFSRVKLVIGPNDVEADGTIPFSLIAAATTNATLVRKGPGIITSIHAINVNAAIRYLKFYDTNQPLTAGVGTPVRRYGIPAATTGAGFTLAGLMLKFMNGIAFVLTTGSADTDATALTAGDVILTLEYV